MQSLIRSKSAGVTGGRGTAGAGPGRDLRYLLLGRHHVLHIPGHLGRPGYGHIAQCQVSRVCPTGQEVTHGVHRPRSVNHMEVEFREQLMPTCLASRGTPHGFLDLCSPVFKATVVTRSRGGTWPREAAADTRKQAGRQSTALTRASSCSCHVTKRFRILATLKQGNKSVYQQHIRICTHGVKTGLG